MEDTQFEDKLNTKSRMEFIQNYKPEGCRDTVDELVQSYKATECNMPLKIHS
jgi:hypothetical protein